MKLIVDEMARFRMLVAGIMVSLAVSTMYGFSLFTEELKDKYGFTQSDLTTISTVCSVLGYCAFFFGMLLDYAGPKVQLVISGFCALVGLGLFGLSLDDVIHSDSRQTMLILMCIFNGIMYFGCPAMDGGSVIPLLMNFPVNRGHIIIIQKTFAGLGSSILMTYFDAYFRGSTTADTKFSAYAYFLGFQALFCTCFGACILDFPVYNPCDRVKKMLSATELQERTDTLAIYLEQRAPFRRIFIGSAIVVALLIHLTVSSIIGAYSTISKGGYIAVWVVAILLLTSTAVVALPFQFLGRYTVPSRPSSRFKGMAEVDESVREQPFDEVEEKKEEEEMVVEPPILTSSGRPQYQGSFWSHLLTPDLWLLFLTFFGAWGTSTVFQYNSAQIYRSKNWGVYTNSGQAFNVALIGVGSALGRCTGGLLDIFASKPHPERKYPVYTTMFLPLCPFLMVVGFLLMILVPGVAIVFPFILTAMGNGMSWGLAAVIVRLVYAKDMGKHYNFLFASGIIATVGLNRFMFGDMFDHYATVQGTSPFCNKPSCVTNQLWILLACNVLSTFAAVGLHWRFSRFSNAELKKIGLAEGEDIVQLI